MAYKCEFKLKCTFFKLRWLEKNVPVIIPFIPSINNIRYTF